MERYGSHFVYFDREVDQGRHDRTDVFVIVFPDLGTVDLFVFRWQCIFFRCQQFFIELFARTETGIFDLDILARDKACQFDHAACQIGDLHRGSHIEDEDFVSFAHKGGFQNQAAGFGDRHEIADDVGMGDGQRTAFCQLFAETRNDGTVAA